MEQQFLEIDPKKNEEQLYYPPLDFASNPEIGSPQEDKYFVDETLKNVKEGCCSDRIIKTDMNSFIHRDMGQQIMLYIFLSFGFIIVIFILLFTKVDIYTLIPCLSILLIFLLLVFFFDRITYFNEQLILESNSILCNKKSLFRRRKIIYNISELDRLALYYKYEKSSKNYKHRYILYFIKTSGEKDKFMEFQKSKMVNDFKGLKYFIDLINNYIQKAKKNELGLK